MGSTAASGARRGRSSASNRFRVSAIALVAVAALAAAAVANAAHVAPVYVAGNPSCAGMLKLEPVRSGTFGTSFDGEAGSITITVRQTSAGPVFDFSTDRATHVVEVAIVKGGPDANVYDYGAVGGAASDSDLHAPLNPANGNWYGLSHLCFATGAMPPPPVDACPNIAGVQTTVPPGMIKDAAGNCVTPPGPPPTDVCPNIAGLQATVPPGMIKDAAGNCVTPPGPPPTDVCPNIDGVQATLPPGMIKDGAGNCVTPPGPPPTDLCPNIAGLQATVPPGMIKDAAGNCVTPPTPAPLVDLAVTKLDTPDPVSAGRLLRYSIRVANRGPGVATGVTVTDNLPSGVTLVSTRASQGSCTAADAKITCRLGRLAVGASATVTVIARPATPGMIVNVARVAGSEGDPNPANNTSAVTTRVVAPFAPPPAPACDSVTVGTRSINVGIRTTLRVVVKSGARPLSRMRVRVRGAGIDVRALTNRAGVARVSVRARRAGIVTITVANQTCQRRIGAVGGSQPELTG